MLIAILMTLIGLGLVNYFFREEHFLLKLAFSFLVGFGLLMILISIPIYRHTSINTGFAVSQIVFLLTISAVLFIVSMNKKPASAPTLKSAAKFNVRQKVLVGVISAVILSSFVLNLYWPVSTWDSVALYDLRAVIYARGELLTNLWSQVNESPQELSYYYSYPPTTSLAHAVSYLITNSNIMVLYSFFYSALIIIFYFALEKKSGAGAALLFTVLLCLNQPLFIHSTYAYTNLPYTVVIFASLFSMEMYIKGQRKEYFFLSLFLTVLSLMIRSLDPFFMLIAGFLLFHSVKKKHLIISFLLFTVVTWFAKHLIDSYFTRDILLLTGRSQPLQVISPQAVISSFLNVTRIKEALIYMYVSLKDYHIYLLSFILTFAVFFKSFKKEAGLAFFIASSVIILLPGILFLSSYYGDWNKIPDSMSRLMLLLYPAILYYIASLEEVREFPEFLIKSRKSFFKKK